ncbi:MAG: pilus assembly protein TadG-related protein [Actinomycetota bacterium]
MKRTNHPSDRGATALLVALCLLLLIGFAALAVDVGGAFDDRRQQQSAVDAGTLAAVQYANLNDLPMPAQCAFGSLKQRAACRGSFEAMRVVAGGLNSRFSLADWTGCTDTGDDTAQYTVGAVLADGVTPLFDCISFTSNLKKGRVWLPTTQVPTSFGRVLGTTSIDISSMAEAGADIQSSSDVLPFALGPTGTGGSQACLFANPTANLDVAPCNGPVQGNFGFLDISLYGNDIFPTITKCTGDTQGNLATNLALGTDHELSIWQLGDPVHNDRLECEIFTAQPNEVLTQTGGSNTGLENGLFKGINSPLAEGRLVCKDGDPEEIGRIPKTSGGACVDVVNNFPEFVDDTPLWNFLTGPGIAFTAPTCSAVDNRQEMEACLIAWRTKALITPNPPPLFTADVLGSPRFAAVPSLNFDPSNGSGNYLILAFVPAYLETIYLGCSANDCDVVHSPGESSVGPCPSPITPLVNTCGVPANGNKNMRALTSFILTLDMLDPSITEFWPSRPGTLVYNLIK